MAFFLPRISFDLPTPSYEAIEKKYTKIMDKVEASSGIPLRMIGTLFYQKVRSFCPQSERKITGEEVKSIAKELDNISAAIQRGKEALLQNCSEAERAELEKIFNDAYIKTLNDHKSKNSSITE